MEYYIGDRKIYVSTVICFMILNQPGVLMRVSKKHFICDMGCLAFQIERDLGRCRPLYNLLVDTINIACTDFLSPFVSKTLILLNINLKSDVGFSFAVLIHAFINVFIYFQNGFWFSIGWCIFFFVPSIIFAVGLVSLYRRTDEYDDADYRSFDEA